MHDIVNSVLWLACFTCRLINRYRVICTHRNSLCLRSNCVFADDLKWLFKVTFDKKNTAFSAFYFLRFSQTEAKNFIVLVNVVTCVHSSANVISRDAECVLRRAERMRHLLFFVRINWLKTTSEVCRKLTVTLISAKPILSLRLCRWIHRKAYAISFRLRGGPYPHNIVSQNKNWPRVIYVISQVRTNFNSFFLLHFPLNYKTNLLYNPTTHFKSVSVYYW